MTPVSLQILTLQRKSLVAVAGARKACEEIDSAITSKDEKAYLLAKANLHRHEMELIMVYNKINQHVSDLEKLEKVLQ